MRTPVRSPLLVGRAAESGLLDAVLARAASGGVGAVLVGGEAGVGKSRLVEAFLARSPAVRVLAGGCVELGADGLPYAPFVAALRGAELDDAERRRLAPLLPGLDAGLDTGEAGDRLRMFEGVLTLLARLAADGPTVLVLEDAHWADRSSLDLLEFLVRNQRAAPASMIAVTHRSDEPGSRGLRPLLAGLGRLDHVERVVLAPFTRGEVAAQASAILGRPADPALVASLHARSDGNPLFVEALLSDTGIHEPRDVPGSLSDLLATRVDRLGDAAAVVRATAVGGIRVPHAVLAAVCGEPVDVAVRMAVDAGVLVPDGDGYRFRHALIRDAVLAGVLPGQRAGLHRRYADVLRHHGGGSDAELSYHLAGAGDGPGAVAAAWAAAAQARRVLAHAEELQLVERVLGWWDAVPDAATLVGAGRATVLETAAEAALRAGESERGERLAGLALAEPGLEDAHTAALYELRARLRACTGHPGRGPDLRAALAAVPLGHPIRPYLLNALAAYLMDLPDPDGARAAAQEALAATRGSGDDPAEASALVTLATLDARLGDLDAQLPRLARATAVARTLGADHLLLRVLAHESHLLEGYGRLADAERVARAGLAAAAEAGLARSAGPVHAANLAAAQLAAGRWAEAGDTLERALELVPEPIHYSRLLALAADLVLGRGELDHASALLDRAAELTDTNPLPLTRLRARLHLAQGEPVAACYALKPALGSADLAVASRYAWPLLAVAAEAAAAAGDGSLSTEVTSITEAVPEVTPPQRAWAATTAAYTSERAADWATAADLWDELAHPFEHATALHHHGAALLAAGARSAAADALTRATAVAGELGATPLRAAVADLARRARLPLGGHVPVGDAASRIGLTPRETEVLALLATGMGNAAIAERLYISPKTASVHVSNILGKLEVTNRVEAAATAHRLGLLAETSPVVE
ncbi:AAA family ATPase [Pseudonocardia sp. DSM 110487]|uniref:helix-turn-helix transcriptional regulator n=1 Tax=Pseudonocardia sp. DSM 110487 TaxID=2865833 RepID=UPI001C69BD50|nr:helix-turn-helix transcriptional regulator [Pseudonocardia sp. DSM 110487]QYN39690.1 AAA family ATPase [Pseudonocardia sp. DSM 110487]